MIKLIVFEDEPNALRRLQRMIAEIRPDWKIVNTADSISSGIKVIEKEEFDLIITDIQLSDGTCFEILKQSKVTTPVIYITAYDEYAIKAFEFNSVHYLLKPVKPEQLHLALEKFEQNKINTYDDQSDLFDTETDFRKKLLSRVGNTTAVIDYGSIAYINYSDKMAMAHLFSGEKYLLDQSLDKLEEFLPTHQYFRINRQLIVNKQCVKKFSSHTSDRLILETSVPSDLEFIVSKEKTPVFRRWMMIDSE